MFGFLKKLRSDLPARGYFILFFSTHSPVQVVHAVKVVLLLLHDPVMRYRFSFSGYYDSRYFSKDEAGDLYT